MPVTIFSKISKTLISFFKPRSLQPLQERNFYKLFWTWTTFLGLLPYKINRFEKFRAILFFLTFCVPTVILLFVAILTSDEPDDKVHGIQTVPVLLLMIFDASNFIRKSRKIEEFCSKFNTIMARYNDEKFCCTKFRATNIYFLTSVLFLICSTISNMTVFALTGKSGIPSVQSDGIFGLTVTMIIQLMFIFYTGSIFLFLDVFMCSLLFLISGYSEHLKDNFKAMKIENVQEIVNLHLEFKTMVKSYEEIFSTVIMLRGLLNTLALSSVVLEIVDKGSSEMTFNVLFFGFNGLFKLFTPCYYGSFIEDESEKIFRNLYDAAWLESKLSEKRMHLILQENFMKTLKVKAMKIVEINLETFVKIIQWTYSMYAALWALKHKN